MKIGAIRLTRMRLPLDPPFYAAWDPVPRRVIGQVTGQPVSVLFGGASRRLPAYASFGEARSPQARAEAAVAAIVASFRAVKIRISRTDLVSSLESVRATRAAVGDDFTLMADHAAVARYTRSN